VSDGSAPEQRVVPLADPAASFRARQAELMAAIGRVFDSGRYILGPEVEAFELEFAEFLAAPLVVAVASGTDAVSLALRGAEVGPGDEVITVSHSAVATVAAIEQVGATVVFADICPERRCIDPASFESMIGPDTRAVVVVHIYGQPADMVQIVNIARRHDIKIIEDCAQAHGARIDGQHVGVFGDAAAFSFYPTKNLAAMGDGGAVAARDEAMGDRLRALRQYGWDAARSSQFAGVNSRLDEVQAAILRVMLTSLDRDVARRREIAAAYDEVLADSCIAPPARIAGSEHAMHLYVVEHDERDSLAQILGSRGVSTGRHYPLAIHQMPAYQGRFRGCQGLSHTERLYARCLSLPMYPALTDDHVAQVCAALEQAAAQLDGADENRA
jgi:dTDP-4-amino-4,6-dideoxygalactose transaminase